MGIKWEKGFTAGGKDDIISCRFMCKNTWIRQTSDRSSKKKGRSEGTISARAADRAADEAGVMEPLMKSTFDILRKYSALNVLCFLEIPSGIPAKPRLFRTKISCKLISMIS